MLAALDGTANMFAPAADRLGRLARFLPEPDLWANPVVAELLEPVLAVPTQPYATRFAYGALARRALTRCRAFAALGWHRRWRGAPWAKT